MAKISRNQPLQSSVLDRLIRPDSGPSGSKSPGQVLRELKESVRRDLENLLNTRWRCSSWPPNLEELNVSLVNYGLPDFTGSNLGSADAQEEFRKILQRVIQNYEPRFKRVQVKLVKNPEPLDRTLRFRIEALLHADPAPEPVVFDSAMKPLTTNFEVKGADR